MTKAYAVYYKMIIDVPIAISPRKEDATFILELREKTTRRRHYLQEVEDDDITFSHLSSSQP